MLYFIATPIGNLADITYRAVVTLKKCDYILCEDTRHSKHLLTTYEIDRPLVSYHKFNERKRIQFILDDLIAGKEIAVISDAGTPCICDPGELLTAACLEQNIPFTVIPGPNAALMALTLSGFTSERFQFLGFLPKTQKSLIQTLQESLAYEGTTIVYESPHRLIKTLQALEKLHAHQSIVIARELTKRHEECLRGTVKEVLSLLQTHPPRGEIVLLIKGSEQEKTWPEIPLHLEQLQKEMKLSLADAIKYLAQLRGIPKREVYRIAHNLPDPSEK